MAISDKLKKSILESGIDGAKELADEISKNNDKSYEDPGCDVFGSEELDASEIDVCDIDTPDEKSKRLQNELSKSPTIPETPKSDSSYFGDINTDTGYPLRDHDKIKCGGTCLKSLDDYGIKLENNAKRIKTLSDRLGSKENHLNAYKLSMEYWLRLMLYRCRTKSYTTDVLTKNAVSVLDIHINKIKNLEIRDDGLKIYKDFVLRRLEFYRKYTFRINNTISKTTNSRSTISNDTRKLMGSARTFMGESDSTFRFKDYNLTTKKPPDPKKGQYFNAKNRLSNIKPNSQENKDPQSFINRFNSTSEGITKEIDEYITKTWDTKIIKSISAFIYSKGNNDLKDPNKKSTTDKTKNRPDYTQKFFNDFKYQLDQYYKVYKSFVDDKNEIYDLSNPQKIENDLKSIICCGKPVLEGDLDTSAFKDPDGKSDPSHNTFDDNNYPTMLDLDYWKQYSNYLTLQNLVPKYWTVGMLIPTPSGLYRLKLPTIWRALACIPLPFGIIVIFLTINGVVISPVVYFLEFKPLADAKSTLKVLFRGSNQVIRSSGTGNAKSGISIINNIDISPEISKSLSFTQDDLPTVKRMGMINVGFLSYLDKWLMTAKPYMGYP